MRRARFVRIYSVGMMIVSATAAMGQDFPNRPVRIITAEAGGGGDFVARILSLGLTASLGQQVIVDNRGGASGAIASQAVAKSPADGYTLLLYSDGIWILPLIQDAPYDPVRDFSPIAVVDRAPNILVVHPSLPVATVKELIAIAKSRPGELNYARAGTGGPSHLAAELFKAMAGVNIVRIAYKGTGPAVIDLVGGHVQVMFSTPASVAPQVKANRLRALAVTSAEPSALAPGLSTVAASGLPGYEVQSVHGVFAPTGTPRQIINRLNDEIVRLVKRIDIKERFFNAGIEVVGSSPEYLATTIKSDMARLGKVIRDVGIKAD